MNTHDFWRALVGLGLGLIILFVIGVVGRLYKKPHMEYIGSHGAPLLVFYWGYYILQKTCNCLCCNKDKISNEIKEIKEIIEELKKIEEKLKEKLKKANTKKNS